MIAATLYGGLGNQMFIYAMVRAASLRNNTSMAFNLKQGFKDDIQFHRFLELNHFQLELPQSPIATFDIPVGKYIRLVSRKLGFNLLNPSMRFIQESKVKRDDIIQARNAFLEGYFAHEKYFADQADVIRRDFTVKEKYVTQPVKDELASIKRHHRPIVMIGIRRYQECASSSAIPKGGAAETPAYFKTAMKKIAEETGNPIFWVFSQQQEWFRENVDDGTYEVVYAQPKKGTDSAIEDFYLMTQCDHFIITKSTYYWWPAWLSAKPHKMVFCPTTLKIGCENWVYLD